MNPTRTRQAAAAEHPAGTRNGGRGTRRGTRRGPADGGVGGWGGPSAAETAAHRVWGISDRRRTWLEASFPARGAIGELGGTIDRTSTGRLIEKARVAWTFSRKAR